MHDVVLILGKQAKPVRLVMIDVALLLSPLQAGIIRVQLERLVEEVWAKQFQLMHHGKEFELMGGDTGARAVSACVARR